MYINQETADTITEALLNNPDCIVATPDIPTAEELHIVWEIPEDKIGILQSLSLAGSDYIIISKTEFLSLVSEEAGILEGIDKRKQDTEGK